MHPELTQDQIDRHNVLFEKANALIEGEIILDGLPDLGTPGFFARRRLNKAISLYRQAIDINSMNSNAMLLVSKIYQRLNDYSTSFEWLLRAREFAPDNPTIAKEAALTASHLGDHAKAIEVSLEALEVKPDDPVIHSNLGLCYILSGRVQEAISSFEEASRLEPGHATTPRLIEYAKLVNNGELPAPTSERDVARGLPKSS